MGDKPSRKECMEHRCADCMGHWVDGKVDCENTVCEMYTYMPYRKKEPNTEWRKYNPRRRGKVTWEECRLEISDEERQRRSDVAKKNLKHTKK